MSQVSWNDKYSVYYQRSLFITVAIASLYKAGTRKSVQAYVVKSWFPLASVTQIRAATQKARPEMQCCFLMNTQAYPISLLVQHLLAACANLTNA